MGEDHRRERHALDRVPGGPGARDGHAWRPHGKMTAMSREPIHYPRPPRRPRKPPRPPRSRPARSAPRLARSASPRSGADERVHEPRDHQRTTHEATVEVRKTLADLRVSGSVRRADPRGDLARRRADLHAPCRWSVRAPEGGPPAGAGQVRSRLPGPGMVGEVFYSNWPMLLSRRGNGTLFFGEADVDPLARAASDGKIHGVSATALMLVGSPERHWRCSCEAPAVPYGPWLL